MGERGAACLLCPNLSVTALGLVRHIQTAHVTDTVDDINKAFGGVKTFRQCPYCPERFLVAGNKSHINSKYKMHGQGPIGHPAVERHTATPSPTLPARRENQQPGGKASGGALKAGFDARGAHTAPPAVDRANRAAPQPKTAMQAKTTTNSSTQGSKQWSDGSKISGNKPS